MRQEILAAARRVIGEKGIQKLTLDEVAAEAGVSKGGLLYHYPSKEALFEGLVLFAHEEFLAGCRKHFEADELAERPGRIHRAWIRQAAERHPERVALSEIAAIASQRQLAESIHRFWRAWESIADEDGLDATTCFMIRLTLGGYQIRTAFWHPLPEETKTAVFERLLAMATPEDGSIAYSTERWAECLPRPAKEK